MKGYEVLFIINSGIGDDKIQEVVKTFETTLTKNEGTIIGLAQLGRKELATEFQKQREGYFIQCQFTGTNNTLDNLQHFYQVTESVIRHLTVDIHDVKPMEKVSS